MKNPDIETEFNSMEDLNKEIDEIDAEQPWLGVGETVTILPKWEKKEEIVKGKDGKSDWQSVSYVFSILQKDGSVAFRRVNKKLSRTIFGKLREAEMSTDGIRYTRQ